MAFYVCVSMSIARSGKHCRVSQRGHPAYGPVKSDNQHSCVGAGIGLTNLCVLDDKLPQHFHKQCLEVG